jgi:hypothetical protein
MVGGSDNAECHYPHLHTMKDKKVPTKAAPSNDPSLEELHRLVEALKEQNSILDMRVRLATDGLNQATQNYSDQLSMASSQIVKLRTILEGLRGEPSA